MEVISGILGVVRELTCECRVTAVLELLVKIPLDDCSVSRP